MTETEWLGYPLPFLITSLWDKGYCRGRRGRRKLRLFACACLRRIWTLLPAGQYRHVLDVCERHAEGITLPGELTAVRQQCTVARSDLGVVNAAADAVIAACHRQTWEAAQGVALNGSYAVSYGSSSSEQYNKRFAEERQAQTVLLFDVFGSPFRPVTTDPSWLTPTVAALAQAAYDNRSLPGGTLDSDRFAVLADALEEAGCAEPAILDHLRGPGPHVRGCFALDLLLGKS